MARPKNEDILKVQIQRLKESQKWRAAEGYDDLWDRMVDLYRGKHYPNKAKQHRMVVNLAFATKNVIAPSVAINNPKFTVNARKPESWAQAIITETVLNYLWRQGQYQDEFRLAVDDFLDIGHGWLKVGYKAKKPINVEYIEDANDDTEDCEGVDDRDETVPGNVESEVRTFGDDDRPFVERISPKDMFVDPDAPHPRLMKWVAQRTKRPVNDVMVDKRYDPKQRAKVGAKMAAQRDDEGGAIDGTGNDSHFSYVDVWEFYDLRKGTVSTFCAEMEEGFLIAPRPMPYAFGHPFVMLRNYEVPDQFYPIGDLEEIEPLQHELNETRTDMMNHRRRYQRKYLIDEEAFGRKGMEALESDKDNTLVPVNLTAAIEGDITKVMAPMPQMGTPPDFYNQSDVITGDIDRVSGVSDYMRGAQAEIRRTATEAAMIQDAQNARAADKLARIESTLAKVGGRLVQLMQQYMTGEMVVRIVGLNSQPMWVQFDADYIKGEFDFEVEGGSTQPRNESFRRQSALQFMEAMMPFLQGGVVNPQAVARHVLQFGFDIKDPDQFFMQPPGAAPAQPGAPTPEGAPPMPGGVPPMPEGGPQVISQDQAAQESPIKGIPAELVAQLMGQQGLPVN